MNPRLRRFLHAAFFIILALATLVALFYAEEDWRGARAWVATKRDLAARGESVDFKTFIPPPVPEAQNLAFAPLFVRALQYQPDPRNGVLSFRRGDNNFTKSNETIRQVSELLSGPNQYNLSTPASNGGWPTGHHTDLARWQHYYARHDAFPHPAQPGAPAEDVLLALTRDTPLLDELARAAAERPLTRFPVNWTLRPAGMLTAPHYNMLQQFASALRLRASARLAAGQVNAAREDLALGFRLRVAMADDPIFIACLVDCSVVNALLQPVWEGLDTRQWSATDLAALHEELQNIDLLAHSRLSLRGERAVMLAQSVEDLQDPAVVRELFRGLHDELTGQLIAYFPRGWYAQNAAFGSRAMQDHSIDAFSPETHRVFVAKIESYQSTLAMRLHPYQMLTTIFLPVWDSTMIRFVQIQAGVDQAITACALEQYYLDHHTYPDTLSTLVPAYLDRVPTDPIDGAPLRYRLTADGRYQLYSVGWDEKDDGGSLEWPPVRSWRHSDDAPGNPKPRTFPTPLRNQGDWVWQYTPAEPPDPPANTSRLDSLPSHPGTP